MSKPTITRIGTVTTDEAGRTHVSGWSFDMIGHHPELSADKLAGYTVEELRSIANPPRPDAGEEKEVKL